MSESDRAKVGRLIGEAGAEVLMRAMSDTGMCCTNGQPLCGACSKVVAELKRDLAKTVDTMPGETIQKLVAGPPDIIKQAVADLIEPGFRRSVAKDFVS